VQYLGFLKRVHEVLEPPTYLEIGIRHGTSLALATSTSIGIDPAYDLQAELREDVSLFKETSDEYFERPDPLAPFGGRKAALAFIDGMHLVEYALRDIINVERNSAWTSVVVLDDILPADPEMAARNRQTRKWTGDVYKVLGILARHRPDLICLLVDTQPTGMLLVLGLDPASAVLADRYDDIVRDAVRPDPQRVPAEVLERRNAIDPETVLAAPFWSLIRQARADGLPREQGLPELKRGTCDLETAA
jgi:hypothetical protein